MVALVGDLHPCKFGLRARNGRPQFYFDDDHCSDSSTSIRPSAAVSRAATGLVGWVIPLQTPHTGRKATHLGRSRATSPSGYQGAVRSEGIVEFPPPLDLRFGAIVLRSLRCTLPPPAAWDRAASGCLGWGGGERGIAGEYVVVGDRAIGPRSRRRLDPRQSLVDQPLHLGPVVIGATLGS